MLKDVPLALGTIAQPSHAPHTPEPVTDRAGGTADESLERSRGSSDGVIEIHRKSCPTAVPVNV
jgi:hypothetical protein